MTNARPCAAPNSSPQLALQPPVSQYATPTVSVAEDPWSRQLTHVRQVPTAQALDDTLPQRQALSDGQHLLLTEAAYVEFSAAPPETVTVGSWRGKISGLITDRYEYRLMNGRIYRRPRT